MTNTTVGELLDQGDPCVKVLEQMLVRVNDASLTNIDDYIKCAEETITESKGKCNSTRFTDELKADIQFANKLKSLIREYKVENQEVCELKVITINEEFQNMKISYFCSNRAYYKDMFSISDVDLNFLLNFAIHHADSNLTFGDLLIQNKDRQKDAFSKAVLNVLVRLGVASSDDSLQCEEKVIELNDLDSMRQKDSRNINPQFANRLTALMKENKITQKKLADSCGITRQAISQYMDGTVLPNIDKLLTFSTFFNVSADYLVGLSDVKSIDLTVKAIHDRVGLSDKAIDTLARINTVNDETVLIHAVNLLLEAVHGENDILADIVAYLKPPSNLSFSDISNTDIHMEELSDSGVNLRDLLDTHSLISIQNKLQRLKDDDGSNT